MPYSIIFAVIGLFKYFKYINNYIVSGLLTVAVKF